MDDIAVIRSMTSAFSEHAAANYFLHTGAGQQGRPSMGSWVSYGLGSECHDLPGFVVLNGGKMPIGGPDSFNSGFLPATYQGSVFRAGADPVANIKPLEPEPRVQRSKFAAMRELDREVAARFAHADALESAIANYEMAFRMQSAVPEFLDLAGESAATGRLYGLDSPDAMTAAVRRELPEGAAAGRARRAVRRGDDAGLSRRPGLAGTQHGNLKKNHEANARAVDQPIAALLRDLKGADCSRRRWWSSPASSAGRRSRRGPTAATTTRSDSASGWPAAGVKGGMVYGATDEYGYKAVEGRCQIHDLHATMLHLLGVDHKRLTYRWGGRDMRLTDVHGELIEAILA